MKRRTIGSLLRGLATVARPELIARLLETINEEVLWSEASAECPGARIDRSVLLVGWRPGRLFLGPSSRLEKGSVVAFGDEFNGFGRICIRERTWIGQYNNLRASGGGSIEIGADCLVSQFCTIVSSNHDISGREGVAMRPCVRENAGVTIGDGVWIGANAVVLPGVTIGQGGVIGAGSVVTREVSPFEIWAGNPARKIGERH